jgi:hypothetical protein
MRFVVDGVTWAAVPVRNGVAQFQTSALALTPPWPQNSPHTVVAVYDGDSTFAGSTSAAVEHVVDAGAIANLHSPVGTVDLLNRQMVKGWASDRDTPGGPVEVQVVVDGRYVGSTVANEWRFGHPLHGFTFMLPTLRPGKHLVLVFAVDTWSGQPRLLLRKVV